MQTLDLGHARLHIHVCYPGLPNQAETLQRITNQLQPAIILLDADTHDGLQLRKTQYKPNYIDNLLATQLNQRYGRNDNAEHPLQTATRIATQTKTTPIILRPPTPKPGWLKRRRANTIANHIQAPTPSAYSAQLAQQLHAANAWNPHNEAAQAAPRIQRALDDGRAPILAILQSHRANAYQHLLQHYTRPS